MKPESAIVSQEGPLEGQIIPSEPTLRVLTTRDLQIRIQEETEQRRLVTDFIRDHMKAGTDYGTIKFTKRDGTEVESKPSLFKPGSEKFCSLFHFRPTFVRDDDTWEMSGKVPGLFCYRCDLVSLNGNLVGEGRGSASITEKQGWTANNAIKIAEKRAQIDAVLRTGGLSDFFTQDLEDMPKEALSGGEQRPAVPPEIRPLQGPITENQRKMIFALIRSQSDDKTLQANLDKLKEEIKTKYGVTSTNDLTKQQASEIINGLNPKK